MKIVEAEAIPIGIPLKKPFTIALGTLTATNHILVRMVDDEGRTGWGETTTFHSVYGYDQKSLYHVLTDYLIPAVLGMDPRNRALIHARMDRAIPFNLMAKTGIDLAVLDLIAQADGIPVHQIFGGKRVDRVPLVGGVDIVSPDMARDMATELIAEGYPVLKVKIGLDDAADIKRVEAVRKEAGDDMKIRVDANQGYDRATAASVFSRMAEFDLEWIEQPLPHWDLEGLRFLRERIQTPIAVDESVYTPQDAQNVIGARAADVVNIKVVKCGGIYRCQKIAAVCSSAAITCYVGGCIETTPGMAYNVHFYAATPNLVSAAEIRGNTAYIDDVVTEPLPVVEGCIPVPTTPGLGVTVDTDKVEHYRLSF